METKITLSLFQLIAIVNISKHGDTWTEGTESARVWGMITLNQRLEVFALVAIADKAASKPNKKI